ncbi:hypothetical protein [Enhygromyxa salina]|uniref:Uncharacterized protein n=1 Tax=Enhygromyxa salina TaxID=215803 RepID=A0A2S9YJM1_9BACT|nr:hypothetical protein [Enhygromyxa salina]PRQ05242.1 hypothetical protein ENSA7_46920 [Enhygromyxa salina]
MSKSRPSCSRSLCKSIVGSVVAAAASLATLLITPAAGATEPEPGAESALEAAAESTSELQLGSTIFGVPRLSWTMAPPLQLQPERARLMLLLPTEWMPTPDYGKLGVPFDPEKSWEFQNDQRLTEATIGTSLRLRITDPEHSIDFRLRLMPRAAIAVLHFDPTARLH